MIQRKDIGRAALALLRTLEIARNRTMDLSKPNEDKFVDNNMRADQQQLDKILELWIIELEASWKALGCTD